jgi:hypothetical protein
LKAVRGGRGAGGEREGRKGRSEAGGWAAAYTATAECCPLY